MITIRALRRLVIGTIIGLAVMAMSVLLDPTCVLLGVVKNESSYRGRPTSYWRKSIQSDNDDAWGAFGVELGGGKPDPAGVPVLLKLLEDTDDQVCFFACNALGALGSEASQAVPALVKMLRHPNIFHRRNAALALARIVTSRDANEAVPTLIQAIEEGCFCVFMASALPTWSYWCARVIIRRSQDALFAPFGYTAFAW